MGIKGLLGLLKEIQQPSHLHHFRGQTLGIDGYGWLYKGCFACAMELGLGLPTHKFLSFCKGRIQLLLHYQIIPYVVFDGADLPMKSKTNELRKTRRDVYREEGKNYLTKGNKKKALECFQKALEVTHDIAYQFIQYLRKENIQFLVAPYEADAQLAYLQKKKIVSVILTEDSDLLVFGATHVLYKLDSDGTCMSLQLHHLPRLKTLNFVHWTHDQFIHMCILAGCDYLPNLPSIGLKKAYQYIQRTPHVTSLLRVLKMDGHSVSNTYFHQFSLAKWTFLHQRVYCPLTETLVHVTPLPPPCASSSSSVLYSANDFLGPTIPEALINALARGQLHPITHAPMSPSPSSTTSLRPLLKPRSPLRSCLLHSKHPQVSKSETDVAAIQVASGFKKKFSLHLHKPFQFCFKPSLTPPPPPPPLFPTPESSDTLSEPSEPMVQTPKCLDEPESEKKVNDALPLSLSSFPRPSKRLLSTTTTPSSHSDSIPPLSKPSKKRRLATSWISTTTSTRSSVQSKTLLDYFSTCPSS
ncbi:Rad2 nuclease [Coelomomyces lativittatus]|nr:Rad2 nuclease [Coelomomyces lativittatus]KAJ1508517.1 Rad2 nuclease [Coelomomyces lativittatus]KAJ1510157.1 Rad2 nuclease [Coelomomyces lativittatus]